MVEISIDRQKCEGKAKCLELCPVNVFELRVPDPGKLSWHSRLRLRFHGGKQAFAVRAGDCIACNICVEKCPENAIMIVDDGFKPIKQMNSENLPRSPFPYWMAFVLAGRLRKMFIGDPETIIDQVGIKEGQTVLEIGCGPGFFTEFIAKKVGPSGKVIAQDVQRQMLDKLEKRRRRFPVKENIQPLLASSTNLNLPSSNIDFIFAANVFEEIAKENILKQTNAELYRVLKQGGYLFFGEHRVAKSLLEDIISGIETGGFSRIKLLNFFYFSALYQKPSLTASR